MRAAVVRDFTQPLSVEDVGLPSPEAGEVLVKIEASGLCHTDIHAAHGDWPVKSTPPLIPGHEGVGIVVDVGEGVTTRAVNGAFAEYIVADADYVVPVDPEDEKLDPAWELGADVAIALAVAPKAFEQAFASLRRGGRLTGRTRIIAETRRLDDVDTCFEEVRSGTVPARLVFGF